MPWLHFDKLKVGIEITDDDANEIGILNSFSTEWNGDGTGKVILEFWTSDFVEFMRGVGLDK